MNNPSVNVFEGIPVGADEPSLFDEYLNSHDFAAGTRRLVKLDVRKFAQWFTARNAERFGQPGGNDDSIGHAPEARRELAAQLGATVDFVGDQERVGRFHRCNEAIHGFLRKDRPGRIVWVADVYDARF